jgi:hypothetical protein
LRINEAEVEVFRYSRLAWQNYALSGGGAGIPDNPAHAGRAEVRQQRATEQTNDVPQGSWG